jgi:hypothetical protein
MMRRLGRSAVLGVACFLFAWCAQAAHTAVVAVYEVGKVDVANATAFCDKDYNEAGFLFCSGLGEDLNFNRQSLRFVHWFPYGYIDPQGQAFGARKARQRPLWR